MATRTGSSTKKARGKAEQIDPANGGYRNGFSLKYGFGRVNAQAAGESARLRKAGRGRRKVR